MAKKNDKITTFLFSSTDFTQSQSIQVVCCEQPDILMHNHEYFEIVYVLSGSAKQTIADSVVKIKEGDYFIVDYGSAHCYSECKDFNIINCLFKAEFIDKTLIDCKSFARLITNYLIRFNYTILSRIPVNNVFSDADGSIKKLFTNLVYEYSHKKAGHIELLRCYLIEILVLSMRNLATSDKLYGVHRNTHEIIDYIDNNFFRRITLSDICKTLNYSLPYLSKLFKADTGMTFNQFLQKKRVEHGCRLLAETNDPIAAVAHAVGYEDLKFFGKVFKEIMNMSPREFRRITHI